MKKFTVSVQKPLPGGKIGRRPIAGYKFASSYGSRKSVIEMANYYDARGKKVKIVRRRSVVSSKTSSTGQMIRDWQYDLWVK